jgi:hypothetical protein
VWGSTFAAYAPLPSFTAPGDWSAPPPIIHTPLPVRSLPRCSRTNVPIDLMAPNCVRAYQIYVAILAAIVVPLSCAELTEQAVARLFSAPPLTLQFLQIALGLTRAIGFTLMIATSLIGIATRPFQPTTPGPPFVRPVAAFEAAMVPLAISTCILSQVGLSASRGFTPKIVHHSIPGLVQPLRDKAPLLRLAVVVFASVFVFYALLGQPSTLAVMTYQGCHAHYTLEQASLQSSP